MYILIIKLTNNILLVSKLNFKNVTIAVMFIYNKINFYIYKSIL